MEPLRLDVTIEQDNTSEIQLERNGWKSSSKRTKHINIQYFYITDRLKAGDIHIIIYKPTGDMERDYLIKALQGKLFHTHCKTLMELDGVNKHMFYEKYKNDKFPASDIIITISSLHNKYTYIHIYIYKFAGVC